MMNYIFLLVFLYLFLGFLLYILQRRILFNRSGKPNLPESYNLQNTLQINIRTADKISLLAWFFKGNQHKPILVYFHGNSFDIGERAYRLKRYIDNNWSVIIVAWRGYSGNKGKPTETNLYLDGESTLNWISRNTDYEYHDLVIYGESLGSGVAVELATRYKFRSVVLEAPFTSIVDIAKQRYKIFPVSLLVLDKFNNIEKIDKILSPLLIISGKKDEIVPHNHSVTLYQKAKEPKHSVFIDEAMHNNLYDFGIEKWVIKFNLELWK